MAMAATPEDFLRDVRPEPFSPSVFLDLPPTPQEDPVHDSDDLILPYISRMLMEEDIDDKFFYQFPDHPALLQAQQPYAQILSDDSGNVTNSGADSSSSPDALASAYDPIVLSQLLQSPPNPDMGIGLPDDVDHSLWPCEIATTAGLQPSQTLYNGAANDGNTSFVSAAKNRGATVMDDEANTMPTGDGDQRALVSAIFNGQTADNMDMLNLAFLKGMEEANKFLPTNSNLEATSHKFFPGGSEPVSPFTAGRVNGRGRKNRHNGDELEAEVGRRSKLMTPEQEETGAGEMLDEIMLHGYDICMKGMEELRLAMDNDTEKKSRKPARGRRGAAEVVDLRTMLIHCAQAVATGDRRSAMELLKQVKQHSSPRGDATQRLAHCFAEGLQARLAGTGSELYQSLVLQRTSVVEFLKAYVLFFVSCPFNKVKFNFADQTIMHAVAGRRRLHIVDYGVQYGIQWSWLLRCLAEREGGPPEVRITGIDFPQPGFRPAFQIEETGRRLINCAREYGVPFKFRGVAAKWETIRAEDLNLEPDEVLVVTNQNDLGKLMDGSLAMDDDSPSPRDVVLRNIRAMRPDVFVQWVVNGTYGSPFFLTRFREALAYYSAHFDVLDATIPRDNDDRLLIERDILGRCALNVIACEGGDRVDRPETYKQWQVRNHRAGLRQLPLQPEVVKMVRDKVRNNHHPDFLMDEDQRWLLQGWKGRVLFAMSTWVADDATATASIS